MPRLAARYRVIRYDARGHGMSPPATAPYTLLDDLIMVLDHLEVARATLVGCSQGGASSIDLALAQPERVERAGARLAGRERLSRCPRIRSWMPSSTRSLTRATSRASPGWPSASGPPGSLMRRLLAQLRSAAKAWLANGEYEKQAPPAFDRLGSITAPAVLLIGDKDHPPLIECDEAIVARIPGCRKIDVPGGDHLLPLRVPGLVADTIEEFAELRPPPGHP